MPEWKATSVYELDPISATPETSPEKTSIYSHKQSKTGTHNSSVLENGTPDNEGNATKPRSKFRIFMIMTALYMSLFIAALDVTIVSTAVPTITADLKSPSGYAWIGGAYLIANAAGAPIWAKLSDIWGRKPILLAAVTVFIVSSIICAKAVDMKMMIFGRAIQGAAGGGLLLLVSITISDLFSVRQRSLYLGFCEGIWAIAGAVGPILGGALTDLASWRWCWWINLPVCGVAFVLILFYLDVHNPKTPFKAGIKAVDWFGCVSILGLTIMLLLGLDFGGDEFPWSSPKVICLLVFGTLSGFLFIYSERKLAEYPLVPVVLFKEQTNLACLFVCFFHGIAFIAAEYYLPLYYQAVRGASALQSGVDLVPLIVATALTGVLTGIFIHRTGRYKELLLAGPVFLTLGYGLYILIGTDTSIGEVIGFQIVAAIGSGLQFEPALVALQAHTTQDDVGTVTSTYNFVRAIGLAISITLGGVVFSHSMDKQASSLEAAGLPSNITVLLSGRNAAANTLIARTLQDPIQQQAVKDAFSWSMRNMWIMYTGFSFCGLIAGCFVTKKYLTLEHTETVTGLKKKESKVAVPVT